jgi:hypothetical protein
MIHEADVDVDRLFIQVFRVIVQSYYEQRIVFSLGFKADTVHPYGFTQTHLAEMATIVKKHDLIGRSIGTCSHSSI